MNYLVRILSVAAFLSAVACMNTASDKANKKDTSEGSAVEASANQQEFTEKTKNYNKPYSEVNRPLFLGYASVAVPTGPQCVMNLNSINTQAMSFMVTFSPGCSPGFINAPMEFQCGNYWPKCIGRSSDVQSVTVWVPGWTAQNQPYEVVYELTLGDFSVGVTRYLRNLSSHVTSCTQNFNFVSQGS